MNPTNVSETGHNEAQAALRRIRRILDTPTCWLDDQYIMISENEELSEAQQFIRNTLDLPNGIDLGRAEWAEFGYEHMSRAQGQNILTDLAAIWGYKYFRDELSRIAMELSLCPMHFGDWASCFDDEVDECAAIRAIFPYGHDT